MTAQDSRRRRNRRSWFRRHKLLTGLGVVIVLFFGSASATGIIEGIRHPPTSPTAAAPAVNAAPNPAIAVPAPAPPAQLPAPVAAAAVPAPVAQTAPVGSTRGLLDPISYWDRTHQRVPEATCAAQGEVKPPIGILAGWRINSGGVACFDDIGGDGTGPPWGGRIVALDVYSPHHVTEQLASRAVATLLPADAQVAGPFAGANNGTSPRPEGSCQHIVYTSPALAAAIRGANPSWTADPSKADAVFYSGHASSDAGGSDKPFTAGSINEVMIKIGDGSPRAGNYTC